MRGVDCGLLVCIFDEASRFAERMYIHRVVVRVRRTDCSGKSFPKRHPRTQYSCAQDSFHFSGALLHYLKCIFLQKRICREGVAKGK